MIFRKRMVRGYLIGLLVLTTLPERDREAGGTARSYLSALQMVEAYGQASASLGVLVWHPNTNIKPGGALYLGGF